MKKEVLASLLALASHAFTVSAVELDAFRVDAYLTTAVAWTDVDYNLSSGAEVIYNTYIHKRPGFEKDTNVGVQLSKALSDVVSFTTQFEAEAKHRFNAEALWAYLTYEPNDKWQFRVGRIRTNPYLLSDYANIGYAYPWVRLPQEVYNQVTFTSATGVDAKYKIFLRSGDLSFSVFYGASITNKNVPIMPNSTVFDTVQLRLRDLTSFVLKYGNDSLTLSGGYKVMRVTIYPSTGSIKQKLNDFVNTLVGFNQIGPDYINYFSVYHARTEFMGLGYQWDWNHMVSIGEIVKRRIAAASLGSAVGWYVMGGYRINKLLPNVTFARQRVLNNYTRRFSGTVNALAMRAPPLGLGASLDSIAQQLIATTPFYEGGVGDQSSLTFGLRWDVAPSVDIKVEAQYVRPEHSSPGLFNYNPNKSVHVYNISVDAVI